MLYIKKDIKNFNEEEILNDLKEDLYKYHFDDLIYTYKEEDSKKIRSKKIKKKNFIKLRTIKEILSYDKLTIKNIYTTLDEHRNRN